MGAVRVVEAVPGDAEVIADIHVRAWQAAYRGIVDDHLLDRLDAERRAAWWRDLLSDLRPTGRTTWLGVRDATVAGFATAGPTRDPDDDPSRVAELHAIYVAPEHWRTSVGSALMLAFFDDARDRFVEATVWVLRDNRRGRAFYEAHRWRPDGASRTELWAGARMNEVRYRITLERRSPGPNPPRIRGTGEPAGR